MLINRLEVQHKAICMIHYTNHTINTGNMSIDFLVISWNEAWSSDRCALSAEEIAAECMGFKKWEPSCPMAEPFVHNVVSTSKVILLESPIPHTVFDSPVVLNPAMLPQVHSIQMPINLERLSLLLKNSTYDKKRFAAITIRSVLPQPVDAFSHICD